MSKLEESLAEMNEVCDRLIERLHWNNAERASMVEELAAKGHIPSQKLIIHFKEWYIASVYRSLDFVERTEAMIRHFDEYKAAGYVPKGEREEK